MHWIIKIGIAAFVIATPIKWVANGLADKTNFDSPSRYSWEARLRRSFVCRAHFNPSTITYHDQKIVVRESWVEKRTKLRYFLVWLPYYENKGGYQLCFTLKEGDAAFNGSPSPFWVTGNAGHSFGHISEKGGGRFYHDDASQTIPSSIKISLLDSWSQPRPQDIEILIDHNP